MLKGHNRRLAADPLVRAVADRCAGPGRTDGNGDPKARLLAADPRLVRLAYERAHGPIPPGSQVVQACGNKRCLEPDHLVAEAPWQVALRHPTTRLSPEDVRDIRREAADADRTEGEIAAAYGVSCGHVDNIKHRRARRQVE